MSAQNDERRRRLAQMHEDRTDMAKPHVDGPRFRNGRYWFGGYSAETVEGLCKIKERIEGKR